ncbi:MAG: winged helix-turn-helix domain-containing protein [Chroococcales cyanobacterium]
MIAIKIIRPTPGPTTTERVLELIQSYPQGMTIGKIASTLNRPVSMVQHCLKPLISSGQVKVRLSENGMQRLVFPVS